MYDIEIQKTMEQDNLPEDTQLKKWALAALERILPSAQLTIRIVNEDEISYLNEAYRKKQGPTNVLAFPFETHEIVKLEYPLVGDVVICAPVVEQEARQQGKSHEAHWAHMVIHGTLHLLGFDHVKEQEAHEMEKIEINILKQLGYENPYDGENA